MLEEINLINNEIPKLIQNILDQNNSSKNEIQSLNHNLIEEINLMKNEIREFKHNLIEEIDLMKNEIRQINQNIIDENVSLKNQIKSKNDEIADLNKNIEVINKEINSNSKKDAAKKRGNETDIENALIKKSLPAVKYYIEQNSAILHQKLPCGRTPLHIASELGCFDIVTYLISKGADIEALEDYNNNTPLIHAAGFGHPLVVKFLIDNRANINYQNNYGSTSLHHAVWGNHLDVVKLLIEMNANKSLRNNNGQTPLDVAKSYNATSIISYLSSL